MQTPASGAHQRGVRLVAVRIAHHLRGAQPLGRTALSGVPGERHAGHRALQQGERRQHQEADAPRPHHQHALRGLEPCGQHRVQRHAERLDQDGHLVGDLLRDAVQLAHVGEHLLAPRPRQVPAVADQEAG